MTLSKWVVNSLDEDYAFDFEVRPTEGFEVDTRDQHGNRVLPSPFYIQLKASEGFDDSEAVWHDFETDFLVEDCLQASVPVVLVICDRSREELYWTVLQRYCWDILDADHGDWRKQETKRIHVDREPLADAIALSKLRGEIRAAEHRISTRQRVASARRGTLHHPVRMDVASASDVRAYKQELVDDAVNLADAGHRGQARRKLVEVCQMAEDGVATVEAYRQLLELREIEDLPVAFAKVRFAREGANLAKQYDHEDPMEAFREQYETAWEYIEEKFIGSKYLGPSGLPVRVLDVDRMRLLEGNGAEMTARVQHGSEFTGLQAPAVAGNDEFELIESGASTDPRVDACAERAHTFDTDDLRDVPTAAICANCGLSRETIQQWLSQEVPTVCDACGEVVYENPLDMEIPKPGGQVHCAECRS
ncbi:DUF4365 domain-containing protein [Halobaculum magnesiiphilum]|uniref:DUF4365 domain-containing protein n=2 Tax=Halobaculum magnesiiphilum TaxID=1017351 RepID=A0A8T8WES3_9EURY|nr:DUF4365 domain-containing protein [Halobaculum magnesiiphilum]